MLPPVPLLIQLPGSTLCSLIAEEGSLLYLCLSNYLGAHSAALLLKYRQPSVPVPIQLPGSTLCNPVAEKGGFLGLASALPDLLVLRAHMTKTGQEKKS